jgi:hypothetical protein
MQTFASVYDFLNSHPGTTRIALGYGIGGTGTDYPGGGNPFGSLAHAVFRFDTNGNRSWPFYIMIASGNDNSRSDAITEYFFTSSGSSVGGSNGVCVMSACIGIGGDENPWNGTTNNDGTDTLPSDRWWVDPSAGTNHKPFPCSNAPRGRFGSDPASDERGVVPLCNQFGANDHRWWMFADDDSFIFFFDDADSGTPVGWALVTLRPDPSISHPNPLAMVRITGTNNPQIDNFDYESGVSHARDAEIGASSSPVTMYTPRWAESDVYTENEQSGNNDTFPMLIVAGPSEWDSDAFIGSHYDLIEVQRAGGVHGDTNAALDKAQLCGNGQIGYVLPWDSATTPGSGATVTGIQFTI